MKNAAKFVGGSVLVYVLVAACAAEEREASRRAAEEGRDASASSSGEAASSSGNGPSLLDPVAEALAEDGSRLRARFLRAGDGARQWAGHWLDTERGEDCTFQRGEDGQQRCLPLGARPIGRVRSGFFADNACTVPVYMHNRSLCTVPTYVLFQETPESCADTGTDATNAVAKVGQLHGGEVYQVSAGCSSAGFTTPERQFYDLEMVPASAFVAAELE